VLFDGEGAPLRALAAATEILHLLSERENVFDEPEPPVVALANGPVVVGSVVWGDQPSAGVAGLAVQQLESLLREAAPGEIFFSKDFYAEIAPAMQQAGVQVRAQRGLLSPQPLAVLSGELAARVTGYQPEAQTTAFPGDRTSLSDVRPGTVLGDRFDVLAELGAGRMGPIFKAQDRELGDLVVLKMLKPEVVADTARFERLKMLIRQARTLRHPNVLGVIDFAEKDGLPYLAVEYARGLTLRYLLDRGGAMTPAAGVHLARQLARGLVAAHQDGLLHLGIKPENVLVEPQGQARLMDFGLAAPGGAEAASGIEYLAPEQLDGQPGDARCDVYAFGVVLYEVVTGQVPYQGSTVAEVRQRHQMQDPDPPGSLAADLPPALEQLIGRAMAKATDGRYGSAAELLGALDALVA
jgi:serine/threonine-protein kinase